MKKAAITIVIPGLAYIAYRNRAHLNTQLDRLTQARRANSDARTLVQETERFLASVTI